MGEVIRFPSDSRPTEPEYPKPDRSDFKPSFGYSDHLDLAWGKGTLNDGRPYRVEIWYTDGMFFLEYYFSCLGLESATKKDLEELLVSEGILVFNSEDDHHVTPKHLTDPSGNKMWNVNVMMGIDDDMYVNHSVTSARSNMQDFERPSTSSVWGPVGKIVEVDPETAETYVALCDEGLYRAYFINNSSKPIDVLFENWLDAVDIKGEDVRIDDVNDDVLKNSHSLIKHANIPPKSYIKLNWVCFDWEFDWEDWIHLALKTTSEEKLLHFHIPKYRWGIKKYERLPVLNREGWVCELQTQESQ